MQFTISLPLLNVLLQCCISGIKHKKSSPVFLMKDPKVMSDVMVWRQRWQLQDLIHLIYNPLYKRDQRLENMLGELLVVSGVPLTVFVCNCIFTNACKILVECSSYESWSSIYCTQHLCIQGSPQSITEVSLPPPTVPQQEQWQTITGLCASAISLLSFPGGI